MLKVTKLLGFGHSMFGEGNVNLPISGGYVHFILPSTQRSFKDCLPNAADWHTRPRPSGCDCWVRLAAHPSYIPVNANIQTMDGKVHSTPYEVMPVIGIFRRYTPSFLFGTLLTVSKSTVVITLSMLKRKFY